MNQEEKILGLLDKIIVEQAAMREELTKVAVTQENIVLPQLKLLAQGHDTIQEQIRHISVIDKMQDDISTLKSAVRFLSQEMEKLKDAI